MNPLTVLRMGNNNNNVDGYAATKRSMMWYDIPGDSKYIGGMTSTWMSGMWYKHIGAINDLEKGWMNMR